MRLAYHRKPTCDGRIGVKTMDVAGFQMENDSKIKNNQMISNASVENLENIGKPGKSSIIHMLDFPRFASFVYVYSWAPVG
jgi:nitric oxide synthase oxygenase domain/subunit